MEENIQSGAGSTTLNNTQETETSQQTDENNSLNDPPEFPIPNTASNNLPNHLLPPTDVAENFFNLNQHNNPQHTIVHVRDRLFHALFYRLAIMYARKFPKTFRRLIEFFLLLLAIASFGLLSYLHVVFNRNPINCLTSIQDTWPREGILRVEIVHNASSLYIMSHDSITEKNYRHPDQSGTYSLR